MTEKPLSTKIGQSRFQSKVSLSWIRIQLGELGYDVGFNTGQSTAISARFVALAPDVRLQGEHLRIGRRHIIEVPPPFHMRRRRLPRILRVSQPQPHKMASAQRSTSASFPRNHTPHSVERTGVLLGTHLFSPSSRYPSLAWNTARLLAYCTSPRSNPVETQYFSPRKCSASSASACASVMGGMSGLRGRAPKPTRDRLAYCRTTRSGAESVAGWW